MGAWLPRVSGIGLAVFGFVLADRPAMSAPACKAQVVRETKGADFDRYKKWIEAKEGEGPWGGFIYVVDIDNDGRPEVVETRYEGSGGYLNLLVYRETNGTYQELDGPPAPRKTHGDGSWYSHDSGNWITNEREPFIQICDTVYISLSDGERGARQGYLWKGGRTVRACDAAWTAFQSADFKTLYDHKLYDHAKNNLEDFLKGCERQLDAQTRLRFLSDLAITRFHLGDYRECLDVVTRAKKEPGFATSKVKAALEHNAQLCSQPPQPKIERSWFEIDKAGDLANVDVENVLANTVPAFDFDWGQPDLRLRSWVDAGLWPGAGVAKTHESFDLRGMVRDRIGPPGDGSTFKEGRYVAMWGCMAHSCEDRGFIWADLTTGTSAFALNDFQAPGVKKDCFAVGSRTLGANDLPPAFFTAYEDWKRHHQDLKHECAYFIDGRTGSVKVTVMAPPGAGDGTRQ